ncbi:MAG: CHAT domain-containing protein [Acidobacteriota bacterium]
MVRRFPQLIALFLVALPRLVTGQSLEDCEAAFAANPEGWNSCACFYRLGTSILGRDAVRQRLTDLLEEDPARPCPHFYLASVDFTAGDDPSRHYRRAATLFEARDQPKGAYYSHASLGRWLRGKGRYEEAVAELERAAAVARRLDDPRLFNSSTLEYLNLDLARGGDLAAIEEGFEALHRELDPDDWPELEMAVTDQLAQVRFRLGDLERAQQMLDRQAERYRDRGDLYGEATARYEAALCSLQDLPRPAVQAEARRRLEGALEVAVEAGNLRTEVAVRRKLGELTPGPAGLESLRQSLAIARRLDEPDALYPTLLALAERIAPQDPPAALQLLAEADPGEETASLLATGWLHRLRAAWSLEEPVEALQRSLLVLDEIERLRLRQSVARAEYFSLWLPAHQWLVGTLLGQAAGEPAAAMAAVNEVRRVELQDATAFDQAFTIGERMRGRILLESLGPEPARRGALLELAEVRRQLASDEALLIFQLGLWRNFYGRFEGGAWLQVIDGSGERLYALPDSARLAPAIEHFAGLFAARDEGQREVAAVLFQQLLEAVVDDLPEAVDHLVLVPDGALHGLPFAALPMASGEPLGTRFRISRVPSATLWGRWNGAPKSSHGVPALVVAAPTFEPSPEAEGAAWAELPGAAREGRAIVRRLGRGSRLLSAEEAVAPALQGVIPAPFSVLHFATHAVVDERRRQRSGVVLAGSGDAALLEPEEIAALDLEDKLVVLAACRTGSGRVLYGEGPMSLARAFFAAGATTVVATRWPLRDDESETFFRHFYDHLAAGHQVAEAVRRSQRELWQRGAPAAAWVGPMVLGRGAARPFPDGLPRSPGRWLWLALVLLLMGLAVAWRMRRRRSPSIRGS